MAVLAPVVSPADFRYYEFVQPGAKSTIVAIDARQSRQLKIEQVTMRDGTLVFIDFQRNRITTIEHGNMKVYQLNPRSVQK